MSLSPNGHFCHQFIESVSDSDRASHGHRFDRRGFMVLVSNMLPAICIVDTACKHVLIQNFCMPSWRCTITSQKQNRPSLCDMQPTAMTTAYICHKQLSSPTALVDLD